MCLIYSTPEMFLEVLSLFLLIFYRVTVAMYLMLKTIKYVNVLTFSLYFWQSVVLNSANYSYKLNVNISFNSS
jgi:hypothetical protein